MQQKFLRSEGHILLDSLNPNPTSATGSQRCGQKLWGDLRIRQLGFLVEALCRVSRARSFIL